MLTNTDLSEWAQQQKRLFSDAYEKAWKRGVERHKRRHPQSEPEREPPEHPDEERKRQMLLAAHRGVDRMASEMSAVMANPSLAPNGPHATGVEALAAWADSNMARLAVSAGAAVWGGEQAGFAQAAQVAGELLRWNSQNDGSSCDECREMSTLGPMVESDWPILPGGAQCGGNCRCGMETVSAPEAEPNPLEPVAVGGE